MFADSTSVSSEKETDICASTVTENVGSVSVFVKFWGTDWFEVVFLVCIT
jgi:hypothetical protein